MQGHDIQLHIHPQWTGAQYQDGRWNLSGDWSILNYTAEEARGLIARGKECLENLLRPVEANYVCVSFRSGSWCIAPSPFMLSVLADYYAYSQHAHGAHFCEVAVSSVTGEARLRRMLGVFAAGRILNDKTARSQAIGGMIWGVGAALTEENAVDPRYGSFANQDLVGYHVPAHADIADLDALFIAEEDDKGNPLKIKGVGELGICGAGAAVANAIYNACGVRVRDYPFTPDKIFPFLPAL